MTHKWCFLITPRSSTSRGLNPWPRLIWIFFSLLLYTPAKKNGVQLSSEANNSIIWRRSSFWIVLSARTNHKSVIHLSMCFLVLSRLGVTACTAEHCGSQMSLGLCTIFFKNEYTQDFKLPTINQTIVYGAETSSAACKFVIHFQRPA